MRKSLTLLLFASALLALAADRRAPGFSLVDSKFVEHDLADYRGKLVLLAFVQTTCPHCATFAENLQAAQEKYGDKIAVLAVVEPPDQAPQVKQFVAGHKISYPVLMDSGQMAYSYVLTPDLKFPRLYLIDGAGMIRGEYEYSALTKEIFEGTGLAGTISRLLNGAAGK